MLFYELSYNGLFCFISLVLDVIPYFYLKKKGFEVCAILEELFMSRKRNVHGQVYGFYQII